jgi:peptide/nickel transport system substrate-binding protein
MATIGTGTRLVILLLVLALGLSACAPAAPAAPSETAAPAQPDRPAGPKVLTIAVARLVNTLQRRVVGAVAGAGEPQIWQIAHEHLVVDNGDVSYPRLATEMPSIEKGTWKVNPDGSVDMTWKLQPNAKWHDGTPFTAADMVFTYEVYKDPDLPNQSQPTMALMKGTSAPDPLTFVTHWSGVFIEADRANGLYPLPRHLLEESYRTDKQSLLNSTRWTSDFVGLGPYKVESWQEGTQIEFSRFDGYFQNRPAFDRVIVRVIPDANTMVANILANDIDVIMPVSLSIDAAAELRRRWEGTGNQVHVFVEGQMRVIDIQHRPEVARPRNGLPVRAVRQALYHATDRDTLSNVITHGLGPVADSWFSADDPLHKDLESAIPQFPYDLAKSRQLFADAGWTPGSDGMLTHRDTGDRFAVEVRGDPTFEREAAVIAANWKTAGADTSIHIIPAALAGDRSQKATASGVFFTNVRGAVFTVDRLHTKRTVSESNRWTGTNNGAYNNSTVDGILDRLSSTIDHNARLGLHRDLLREQLGDVAAILLYWNPEPVPALKSVTGIKGASAWNFYEWNKS